VRPLYFAACAPPRSARGLATQAQETLRPYIGYLNSAKQAAGGREARSRCQWEPVLVERSFRLDAVDTLVELVTEGLAYSAVGWSGPAPAMPFFIGKQFRPVQPLRVEDTPAGPVLWLAEPIDVNEPILWAGQSCRLEATSPAWPARLFGRRSDGGIAAVRHRADAAGDLRLVLEGLEIVELFSETGEAVPYRDLAPDEGATHLRGERLRVPWKGERILSLQNPPDTEVVTADNGVRWRWSEEASKRQKKRGVWVQLLASDDGDGEATIDSRSAYCEEGVRDVRTQKGRDPRSSFRVLDVRRDSYRLELDRLPPEGSTLFLPSNTSGLKRQLEAVYRLKDSPLPHQRGLLNLCEAPGAARWQEVEPTNVDRWFVLDDDRWDGTLQQREFVKKALGTPDFAFLEGPPGSGKTHAICELVLQLIERNQRVLLCSTTHVAVDNVLDRLVGTFPQVEAIRIGLADRVDLRVRACQIDERIDALKESWRKVSGEGGMSDLDDTQVESMAEATVLASANLTCGTTTGILAHPYIRRKNDQEGALVQPHFDVLILDEASKTTFQEFLVPAQLASRWIIVGDVRQLPPFTDPRDIEASLTELSDDRRQKLPVAYQRACLLLFQLLRREAGLGQARWLLEEPGDVLDALVAELVARQARGDQIPEVVRLVERATSPLDLAISDLEAGEPSALRLLAADWVLVGRGLGPGVARFLPADLLALTEPDAGSPRAYRFRHWSNTGSRLTAPVRDRKVRHTHATTLLVTQRDTLREATWAKQIAWRLGRVHQLSTARNSRDREGRQAEVDSLFPAAAPFVNWVPSAVDAIRDVGVQSVIEALRVRRSNHRVRVRSALTDAVPSPIWEKRAVLLTHQHRMHPDISALPRELFYESAALLDANTLQGREARVGWSFLDRSEGRRLWVDVRGAEIRGANPDEVDAMRRLLLLWREFAAANPRRDGRNWEVACLSFYNRQALAIRDMLRDVTRQPRAETRFELPSTSLSCTTVDNFQGREADVVLLSLRNTRRPGHLDSPNRLNVAITRARFLLMIIGHRRYFADDCPSDELSALATKTPLFVPGVRP
jgi:AAA domain-containing protein